MLMQWPLLVSRAGRIYHEAKLAVKHGLKADADEVCVGNAGPDFKRWLRAALDSTMTDRRAMRQSNKPWPPMPQDVRKNTTSSQRLRAQSWRTHA